MGLKDYAAAGLRLPKCLSRLRREGRLLVSMEAYFDGSKDSGDWMSSRYVTLAGFAAEDDVWARVDVGWDLMLANTARRPKAEYIHMREINALEGSFNFRNGWNRTKVAYLIQDAFMFLQTVEKEKFRMFAATVDIQAHHRLIAEGLALPSPVRMCTDHCCDIALGWYLTKYPGLIDSARFFFDPSEPFKSVFEARWQEAKSHMAEATGWRECWSIIKTVTTIANSRNEPAMQCADLLAWASNRNLNVPEHSFGKYYHYLMKAVIPSYWVFIDEAKMRNYRCIDFRNP